MTFLFTFAGSQKRALANQIYAKSKQKIITDQSGHIILTAVTSQESHL